MHVPLLAPYLILIVVTRSALLRLRLVFLYRTLSQWRLPWLYTLLCYCLASLPLSSFSMILSPFCFYVESL